MRGLLASVEHEGLELAENEKLYDHEGKMCVVTDIQATKRW